VGVGVTTGVGVGVVVIGDCEGDGGTGEVAVGDTVVKGCSSSGVMSTVTSSEFAYPCFTAITLKFPVMAGVNIALPLISVLR